MERQSFTAAIVGGRSEMTCVPRDEDPHGGISVHREHPLSYAPGRSDARGGITVHREHATQVLTRNEACVPSVRLS
jgi:hypothetical protein